MRIRLQVVALLLCSAVLLNGKFASGQKGIVEPPHAYRVGFIMLGVADIQKAVDFYVGKLGLKVTRQTSDLAILDAGPVSIAVSSEVGREPGDSEIVFSADHVKAAYDALAAAGIRFDQPPHSINPQAWAANFRDPDGHKLSVYGPE